MSMIRSGLDSDLMSEKAARVFSLLVSGVLLSGERIEEADAKVRCLSS